MLVPLLLLGRADEALAEADRLAEEPEAVMYSTGDCSASRDWTSRRRYVKK
jgi:hypothetical protein